MEDVELITKEELEDFLKKQEHIRKLVEVKTIELAKILHGREPEGEVCGIDIEESEFKKGCVFVEFEMYACGTSWHDQYNLPFEFLYNEKYPIHYKYLHEEKQRELNKQIEVIRQEDKEREERELEEHERSEYERLRKKYDKLRWEK